MPHTDQTRVQLAQIQARLQASGLEVSLTDKETLRFERAIAGKPYAVVHVMVAEAFLASAESAKDKECRPFWDYHYEELSEDSTKNRCMAYLLVVGEDEFIYSREFAVLLEVLPLDPNIAKKYVCGMSELEDWVANPFVPWSTPASEEPVIHVVPEIAQPWEPPLPADVSNATFERKRYPEPAILFPDHPQRDAIHKLTALLFRRVMGASYQVTWVADGWPRVGRQGASGVDLPWASSNEQLVFSLAAFLAHAYVEQTPGLHICLPPILGYLDSMRLLAVGDCLRDFHLATGASMRITVSGTSMQENLERRLRHLPSLVLWRQYR